MAEPIRKEPFQQNGRNGGPELLALAEWQERMPWLSAGFTTRKGGVSSSPWSSLNCGLHVGDTDADVIVNRRLTVEALGFPLEAWTCAEQVHGNDAAVVTEQHRGAGSLSRAAAIQDKDALVTNTPGVLLTVLYADCVPIFFADPVHRAIGIAHAGWRGTVADVVGRTVDTMAAAFGSDPSRLYAAIGPSIGGCCYEVDQRVIDEVIRAGGSLGTTHTESSSPDRFLLDLSKVNEIRLLKAGILPNHIEITGYCTSCRTDLFFSHRKEGGRTGRMAAWMAVKEVTA